jgi:hypothetical protein
MDISSDVNDSIEFQLSCLLSSHTKEEFVAVFFSELHPMIQSGVWEPGSLPGWYRDMFAIDIMIGTWTLVLGSMGLMMNLMMGLKTYF